MKKSRAILSLLVFCVVFVSSFAVAYDNQEYFSLVYCNYSLNDKNFGSWDSAAGSGVFYSIRNERSDVQNIEPRYLYYDGTKTTSRRYFSTKYYGTSSENSSIPILDLGPGKENTIYARCKIKNLADVRVPITYYSPFSNTGQFKTVVTADFNLTNFTFPTPNNLYTLNASSGDFASSKVYLSSVGAIPSSELIVDSYKLISYTDDVGDHMINWPSEYLSSAYYASPNEEIDFVSSYNLSGVKSSSLLFAGISILGNGDAPYMSSITAPNENRKKATLLIYLRSTFMTPDQQYRYVLDNLVDPEITFKSVRLKGGSELKGDNVNYTYYHFFKPGEVIEGEITINNSFYDHDFSSDRILEVYFEKIPSYGIGYRYGSLVRPVTNIDGGQTNIDTQRISSLTIVPKGTSTVHFEIPYFGDASKYQNYTSFVILETSLRLTDGRDSPGRTTYAYGLTDGFPYLGLGLSTSTINLKNIGGQLKPAFVFNTTVVSLNYINPTTLSSNDDYYMSFHIYDTETQKDVYNITVPINSRTVYQSPKNQKEYGVELIVGDSTKFNPNKNYLFDAYLVYNGSSYQGKDWKGKRISTLTAVPTVNPGLSIYSSDEDINIGYESWPDLASGENIELSIYNPSFYPSNFNISLSDIDWSSFSDSDFSKHMYICLSTSPSINNFDSCLFTFRNGTTSKYPNVNLGTFSPFQLKKYYLHVYCNDTSLAAGKSCLTSPNVQNKYANIYLAAVYSNSAYKNLKNEINISINHESYLGYCGDGRVIPPEACDTDVTYSDKVCHQSTGPGDLGCLYFDPTPTGPGIERSFWVYDDNGQELGGNIDSSRKVRLVATVHQFTGVDEKDFDFKLYENGKQMPDTVSSVSKKDYPTGNLLNKANISSRAYFVSELGFVAGMNYSFNTFIDNFKGNSYSGRNSRNITFSCIPVPESGCTGLSESICRNSCSFSSSSIGDPQVTCTDKGADAKTITKSETAQCKWSAVQCTTDVQYTTEVGNDNLVVGSYEFSATSQSCEGEFKIINIIGKFIGGAGFETLTCPNLESSVQVPCRSVAQLPFFGKISFLLSAMGIVLIYFLILKKGKKFINVHTCFE